MFSKWRLGSAHRTLEHGRAIPAQLLPALGAARRLEHLGRVAADATALVLELVDGQLPHKAPQRACRAAIGTQQMSEWQEELHGGEMLKWQLTKYKTLS